MPTEILLTNDDGIDAVGIRALADALSRDYDVTVVAPATNQSGVGGARSWWETTVDYTETDRGYAVEGTPADCVAVADVALGLDPDVVVSGCNHGPNIGAHILTTPGAILVGLLAAFVVTALLAVALDRAFYKPMRDRDGISLLIASIGAALIVRYLLQFVYGSDRRGITASVDASNLAFDPLGLSVNAHELTILVAAVGLMLAMHGMLQHTKLGTAMRAMADNKDLALITGIPAERVVTATWIIGGGLAGASGYLYVLLRGTIQFDFGWLLLLLIFAAVILGGIGSVYGAIVGGLVIGVVFTTSTIWIPSDFNQAAAFGVMILMLLLRPEGLFGGVTTT
ncbi:hypothetical protein DJ72_01355 [Halorubrum distributum]|nr:hypothetical protein DJ72_01355 [Halorubrum distributum]